MSSPAWAPRTNEQMRCSDCLYLRGGVTRLLSRREPRSTAVVATRFAHWNCVESAQDAARESQVACGGRRPAG